jgi:hypothetical protein
VGPSAEAAFVSILGEEGIKNPFEPVVVQALDEKTDYLVSLAACLAAGCDCTSITSI